MAEDYYGDTGGEPEVSTPVDSPEAAPEEGTATGLLPKEFFQGKPLEIGTVCEVKIERVHDNQVEVSYVPHGETETAPEEAAEAAPAAQEDMAALMG